MSAGAAREARLREIVGAVARQALADWGAERITLLDDGSPEAELAARWLGAELPAGAVFRVRCGEREVESLLQLAGPEAERSAVQAEGRRLRARLVPGALPASAANKTALLLGGALPPEPLLPLGDLYASEVRELAGGWSAPAAVRAAAEAAGGVDALDRALRALLDGRDPRGLAPLPAACRPVVEQLLAAGAASRTALRVVPKIGTRTLGVDLYQ